MSIIRERALEQVRLELDRQAALRESGKFEYTAEDYMQQGEFARMLAVLTEETGEVARAINDGEPAQMRKELVQVAAVAVSAIIGFDVALAGFSRDEL